MAKIAGLKGYYDVDVFDYPVPEPMDDSVLIKVEAAAICGSEHGLVEYKEPHAPGAMGHEFCGRVVKMGKNANKSLHVYGGDLQIGDRIVVYPHVTCGHCKGCLKFGDGVCGACEDEFFYGGGWDDFDVPDYKSEYIEKAPHFKGGFGEYVHVLGGTYCWKVPEDMPSEIAALLDPMAVAMRAVEQAMTTMGALDEGISTSTKALIVGAGPIGVMAGMILKTMGVEQLIITDFLDKKLEMAKEISNADIVMNVGSMTVDERIAKIREITDGGADLVINAANHPASCIEALQMVRFLGHYVEIGNASSWANPDYRIAIHPAAVFFERNVHITAVCANSPSTFDRAFHFLMRYKELPIEKFITHRFKTLEELLPTIKKMKDPDYLKGVWIPEE